MQLKNNSVRSKLAIATSALLLSTPIQAEAANANNGAITDSENSVQTPRSLKENFSSTSGLYYSEEDRVTVKKVQSKIAKILNDDNTLNVNVIYDTMSGASPNGRIFTDHKDSKFVTTTSASGNSSTVKNTSEISNQKTWLTEFEDTRFAASVDWESKVASTVTTTLGVAGSYEDDYDSYSGSGNILFEFNQKRTSLNLGAAMSIDTVKAGGGIPEGLGILTCTNTIAFQPTWLDCDTNAKFFKPGEKIVKDYLIGITQIWNRRTIFQLNYAFSNESGYLTDPYKQVSIFKSTYGESAILHEKRPDERSTNSLFFKFINVPVDNVALNFSYRYFWDNWKVNAHTADGRLRLNLTDRIYIQGHGRLHKQDAAFFFDKKIDYVDFIATFEDGSTNTGARKYKDKPEYLSTDSRLGKIISATAGIKVGMKLKNQMDLSARVERMQQHYYNGVLPRLKVWIAQVIFSMKF